MSEMADSEDIQQLTNYECHFTWGLEEKTIKNHSTIMGEINRHIEENPDMKIEALLFKGYLFIANTNGVIFNTKENAMSCFVEVKEILSDSQATKAIENGYLAVVVALQAYTDRHNKTKFKNNISRLSKLYSSFANDHKFFASIQATKAFALSKVSLARCDEIVTNFRMAIRSCPDNIEWLFSLGLVLWRKAKLSCLKDYNDSEFKEAEVIFKDVLRKDFQHNHAMVLLADICKRRKMFDEANHYLQKARKIKRNVMYISGFSAKIYREMGMYSEARSILEHAESLGDPSSFILHQLSHMYEHEGDSDACIYYLKKAIETDNCNLGAICGLGLALERCGQTDEAYEHYNLMLHSFDQDSSRIVQINNSFGLFLLRLGKVKEAITKFESAINIALKSFQGNPDDDSPVTFDAVVRPAVKKSIEKLRFIYKDRMLLSPNDVNLILHRAKFEMELRCFEVATTYFHKVIMKPHLSADIKFEVLRHLAEIKLKTDRLSEATDVVHDMEQSSIDEATVEIVSTYKAKLAVKKGKMCYKSGNTVQGKAYYAEAIALGSMDGAKCLVQEIQSVGKRDTDFIKLCAEMYVLSESNGGELQTDIQDILYCSFKEEAVGDIKRIQFTMEKHILQKRPALEYAKDIIHKTRITLNRMMKTFRKRHYPQIDVPCNFFTANDFTSPRDIEEYVKDTIERRYKWSKFQQRFCDLFDFIVSIQPSSNPELNNWMIALQEMDDQENKCGDLGNSMEIEMYIVDETTQKKLKVAKEWKTLEVARTACDNIADILNMFNKYQ